MRLVEEILGRSERGRLTPVDIIFTAAGLFALAALAGPLYTLLGQTNLGTGADLLFRMLPASLVAMLIFTVYRTSLIGGS